MGVARSGAEGWGKHISISSLSPIFLLPSLSLLFCTGFFADSADTLYNAGGRWIRASCGWGIVESTKGVYNFDCMSLFSFLSFFLSFFFFFSFFLFFFFQVTTLVLRPCSIESSRWLLFFLVAIRTILITGMYTWEGTRGR